MQSRDMGSSRKSMLTFYRNVFNLEHPSVERQAQHVPVRYRTPENYENREQISDLGLGRRAHESGHVPQAYEHPQGLYNTVVIQYEGDNKDYVINYSSRSELVRILGDIRSTKRREYGQDLRMIKKATFNDEPTPYVVFAPPDGELLP
jgi:hypothetical protein